VFRLYRLGPIQIGDGSRNLQDAVVRARGPKRDTAFSKSFSPSAEIAQCFRIPFGAICAFEYVFFPP
jgi:hypothetical protein